MDVIEDLFSNKSFEEEMRNNAGQPGSRVHSQGTA